MEWHQFFGRQSERLSAYTYFAGNHWRRLNCEWATPNVSIRVVGEAPGLFPSDERGSGTRDSKIEIVRVPALVLEPWVTAAVESRRFQSRRSSPRPPRTTLHPWRPFLSLAEVISIVGTVAALSLSLPLSRTLWNSIREFQRWKRASSIVRER